MVLPMSHSLPTMSHSLPKSLKLTYFNIKARGEPIRLALSILGLPFEDSRLKDHQEFKKLQSEGALPMNQVPLLTVDETVDIAQSTAILRFIGKFSTHQSPRLYPEDPYKAALVDQLISMVQDVEMSLKPSGVEQDAVKRLAMRIELSATTLPTQFGYIDKFLASKKTGDFLLGTFHDVSLLTSMIYRTASKHWRFVLVSNEYFLFCGRIRWNSN